MVVDSTMTGLSCTNALFVKSQRVNDKLLETLIPLRPIILVTIQNNYLPAGLKGPGSRISNHITVSPAAISIPIPLVAKGDGSAKSPDVLLGDYFREEQYTHSFFPYPEQGSPRPAVPSFHLVCTRDVVPVDVVIVEVGAASDG